MKCSRIRKRMADYTFRVSTVSSSASIPTLIRQSMRKAANAPPPGDFQQKSNRNDTRSLAM